ncbi:MAG: FKBP-type peptidyl-prolyl cis-trans isomerase [Cyclobacteriaceae bacterium]|nr:FKBP-type peptidyl-prolyl cis-trans isomerase [Cyclobacteriaceae bacterium]
MFFLRYIPVILLSFLLMNSCKEEEDPCAFPASYAVDMDKVQSDLAVIDQYLADSGLVAQSHDLGLRYMITKPGTGVDVDYCSKVYVEYKGMLLDGTVFDATPSGKVAEFFIFELIYGWRIGIPLIKPGGEITLFVPSPYAYGTSGSGSIPPDSILIFQVKLKGVY